MITACLSVYSTPILANMAFLKAIFVMKMMLKKLFHDKPISYLKQKYDPNKHSAMKSLLKIGCLRATFPTKLEYELGLAKFIPHRLVLAKDLKVSKLQAS